MKQLTLLAIFLAATIASARAAVNVGDHPNLKFTSATDHSSVDLAAMKGKIVIVDFWATWCGPCMQEAAHVVQVAHDSAPKGVRMIGISLDESLPDMQRVAKEKGFDWPQYFDGQVWQNRIAQQYGVNSIPQTFIIGPDGTVLWRGHPALIDAELSKAIKEHPPQLVDPQVLTASNAALDKVEAAVKDQHFADALKLMAAISPDAKADTAFAARAAADQKTLDDAASTMLAEADKLVQDKQYTEAAAKLKAIGQSMADTPTGKSAMHKLSDLRSNPAAASAIAEADRIEAADKELAAAMVLKPGKNVQQAYVRFKAIVKRYPGTPAAATAAKEIAALDADPAFTRAAAAASANENKTRARSALSLATSYVNAGNTDAAREKFQYVIKSFPDTPEAATATEELAKLPK